MIFAHTGFAVAIIGMVLTSSYGVERDVRVKPGDVVELAGYHFELQGIKPITAVNYQGHAAIVNVRYDGQQIAVMEAQKRLYLVQRMPMTEAAVDAGLTRDLFVALGEQFQDGSWGLRVYHKPFIRWIWFGGLIIAFGGLCAIGDRRYRAKRKSLIGKAVSEPVTAKVA